MSFRRNPQFGTTLVAIVACVAPVIAQAQDSDDFPRAFRHEATRVQSLEAAPESPVARPPQVDSGADPSARPATSPDVGWSADRQGLAEVLPTGLQRSVFEEVLRVNFFGTYLFYSRLSDADRAQVFSAYAQSGTIESVRADVMARSRLRHRLR